MFSLSNGGMTASQAGYFAAKDYSADCCGIPMRPPSNDHVEPGEGPKTPAQGPAISTFPCFLSQARGEDGCVPWDDERA